MRNTVRLLSLLLCLVLLWTCVAAADLPELRGTEQAGSETAAEPAATEPAVQDPAEPAATEPAAPDPTEPVVTEPAAPDPTEPVVTEPAEPEPTEPVTPPEPPLTELTDQQIIDRFSLKTKWSRKALIFAVQNGILEGVSANDLAPKSNITHAEIAAMLTRILKTEKLADLSAYTGATPTSWYYRNMQQAVALGFFPISDPNSKVLTPHAEATREEVFVVLARMFGVHSDSRQAIYRFPDWANVSEWAATDLSAMIEAGYVAGSNGLLLPKDKITREEFAQVLSELLTKVSTSLDTSSFTGRLALASTTVPANVTINGDLLLSPNCYDITLDHLTVTGRLIIQGNGMIRLRFVGCSIHELVLARSAEVLSDSTMPLITNHETLRLFANAQTIVNYGAVVVFGPYTVTTLNAMNNARVAVGENAVIQNLNVLGNDVFMNGAGSIQKLIRRGENLVNHVATTTTVDKPYNTAETVTVTRTDSGVATVAAPVLTLGLKLANMPDGWSECNLRWFVNGSEIKRESRVLLKEGSVITMPYDYTPFLNGAFTEVRFTVYLSCRGKNAMLYLGYVDVSDSIRTAAENIRTQNVQGKLREKGTLYSTMGLSGAIASYPAGTRVTILQSREKSYTQVRMSDGTEGWMAYSNVAIISGQYYTTTDYSDAVKEYYVNKIKKWGSSTNYMIWVSLWPQRINIFKGSKGNWKLVKSGPIASGRNDCPTPVEDVRIEYKTMQWSYQYYYCHHVSVFDSARGFHSRPTRYDSDGGGIYTYTIGQPASAGCVRLLDEDCIYIYDNCPKYTAVHIY